MKKVGNTKKDWKTSTLGEVIKLEYGKPLPVSDRASEGEYLVYGANGVKTKSNKFYFDKPSIIVGRKGSAGEVTLVEAKFWPLDVTYFVTFDTTEYDLKYLYLLLKSLDLPKLATGVKPGINRNDVYRIIVTIPSLSEQKRIVKILDEKFVALEKLKNVTEAQIKDANELFESSLISYFTEGISSGRWPLNKIEDYCKVVVGYVGPIARDYTKDGSGVILLSTKNISSSGITLEKLTRVTEVFHKKNKKSQLFPGDVLVARHGNSGESAVIPDSIPEAHALNVIVIKKGEGLSSEYVSFLLNSGVLSIINNSRAGSVQQIINTSVIKNLVIPVPDEKEQNKVVEDLKRLQEKTAELKQVFQKKISGLEDLKKSYLEQAFAGKL